MVDIGNMINTWGKYGVFSACISSVWGLYENGVVDRNTVVLISSFKTLVTGRYDMQINYVMMAQKNKETY